MIMKQQITTSTLGKALLVLALLVFSSGCTTIIVKPLLDPLSISLQKQTDLALLQEGAPTLLLLLDGFVTSDPDNEHLLMATTKAYGAYASILYEEGQIERAVNMSKKSKEYGINLLKQVPGLENINDNTLDETDQALDSISHSKVEYLFWGAYGWATWIQFQDGWWNSTKRIIMAAPIFFSVPTMAVALKCSEVNRKQAANILNGLLK